MPQARGTERGHAPWRAGPAGAAAAARGRALAEARAGAALDANFFRTAQECERRLGIYAKAPCIRVEAWLRKLCERTENVEWKRNRNSYARLRLQMLNSGRLEPPFHKGPADGPLGMLPKWLSYVEPDRACGGGGEGGAGALRSSPVRGGGQKGEAGGPGKWDGRWGGGSGTEVVAAAAAAAATATGDGRSGRGKPPRSLADDARAQAEASGRELRRPRMELEAALGASRERVLEPEWRLQVTEDKVREQDQELVMLRKLLKAKDDEYASRLRQVKRQSRCDIDEVIRRYERRRQEWAEFADGGAQAAPEARTEPPPTRPDPDFLLKLESFRRQTDQLREKLFK